MLTKTNDKPGAIGERLKQAREAAGLSKSELARRIGVHPSACIQWESPGGTNPSMEHLVHAAVILDISLEWLGTGRGEMTPAGEAESNTDDPAPSLTTDEQELIEAYRQLNPMDRRRLLDIALNGLHQAERA